MIGDLYLNLICNRHLCEVFNCKYFSRKVVGAIICIVCQHSYHPSSGENSDRVMLEDIPENPTVDLVLFTSQLQKSLIFISEKFDKMSKENSEFRKLPEENASTNKRSLELENTV